MSSSDWFKPFGIVTALLLGDSSVAAAEQPVLAVGDSLPALVLHDQNGAEVKVDAGTRLLLLTRDMDGGGVVKEALAEGGKEKLAASGAVYVSDVSRMPGFVRSAFAMPSLRKRPYPVLLDESGDITKTLPWVEGQATLLTLEAGKIVAVTTLPTAAALTAALAR